MNFARDVIDAATGDAPALIELRRDGKRRCWTYDEVSSASARLAGHFQSQGLQKGDIILIWLGNRSEWVLAMLACFRLGIVAASCPEQLRAKDLQLRIDAIRPALVLADERNRAELLGTVISCPVTWIPDARLFDAPPARALELDPGAPCLITFTSGTSGVPKPVLHVQRYLTGQTLQAKYWLGVGPGDVVWCTASSGWSKSARNTFVAPWLRGGTALIHDGRFDPGERIEIIARERVQVLCMAPTEYRIITKRAQIRPLPSLTGCVAAGEALDPTVIAAWREATGVEIRDGYGQTETGQLTGFAPGERVRPGSMGRPLPGICLWLEGGELLADPETIPTFFDRYGTDRPIPRGEAWHTGDHVAVDEDGYLWFEGRADDVIISAGYRIGPFEVESALASHPAVHEAAVVAAPDEERGAIVRAIVVLSDGYTPSEELAHDLQDHVKRETAPYKYPRLIEFAAELPRTPSGKIKRAELRAIRRP